MFVKKFKVGDLVRYVGPLPLFAGLVGRVASQFYAHAERAWKYKIKFPGESSPSWFDEKVLQYVEGDFKETGFKLRPTDPAPATTVADAVGAVVSATLDYHKAQEALQQALQEEQKREEAQRLADEEKARKTAVLERIRYEKDLAQATISLLGMWRRLPTKPRLTCPLAQHWQSFAMSCSHWPKPMAMLSCLWVMAPVPLSR